MVKTKQQKSKPKKQTHVKKHGKQEDILQLITQLDALGLKIIQVTADGNCFFRAIANQLEGNEEEHGKYRSMVVQYIMKNREMFEPFIEDEVPFDDYCQNMGKDGTWAGHMELQAASLVTQSNICIHRNMSPRWYIKNFDNRGARMNMSPRWYIKNFDNRGARMVHLSYHDGEHYNSVRLKEDICTGPARPVVIKADADLSASSNQAKAAGTKSRGGACDDIINQGSIKLVMAGSCCGSAEKVEQVLLQAHGDVDAAIEFLIAEQAVEDDILENSSMTRQDDTNVDGENASCVKLKEEPVKEAIIEIPSSSSVKPVQDSRSASNSTKRAQDSGAEDKKIPRNKVCPCGSKKKYKACCGSVQGKSSSKSVINQTVDTRKGRKEKKQNKRGESAKSTASSGSDGAPDLGALCI